MSSRGSEAARFALPGAAVVFTASALAGVTFFGVTFFGVTFSGVTFSGVAFTDGAVPDTAWSDVALADVTLGEVAFADAAFSDVTFAEVDSFEAALADESFPGFGFTRFADDDEVGAASTRMGAPDGGGVLTGVSGMAAGDSTLFLTLDGFTEVGGFEEDGFLLGMGKGRSY